VSGDVEELVLVVAATEAAPVVSGDVVVLLLGVELVVADVSGVVAGGVDVLLA
jgi:hypothetical protein